MLYTQAMHVTHTTGHCDKHAKPHEYHTNCLHQHSHVYIVSNLYVVLMICH